MSARAFLADILTRKDDASAIGMRMDLIVLPLSFAQIINKAAIQEDLADDEYRISETGNVYLLGIKVLWSNGRLPAGQAWFRYSRMTLKERLL